MFKNKAMCIHTKSLSLDLNGKTALERIIILYTIHIISGELPKDLFHIRSCYRAEVESTL